MLQLTILNDTQTLRVSVQPGQPLGDVLHAHVPAFAMPCAGNHTCGKCRVQVSGPVSFMTESERKLLGDDAGDGVRLACFCRVEGDVTVTLQSGGSAKILSWYRTPEVKPDRSGYGFAVDIGTTTVAMQLIHRPSGRVVAERLAENAQRGFGADVISRIEACRGAGLATLSDRIAAQLEDMAAQCLAESGVSEVEESVVTGNSTMLHIYEGLDPASLAVVPFAMQSYFGGFSRRTLAGKPVYLPRCVGAYVGADITCALLAAGHGSQETQLLADIGTNGEIALTRNGTLTCCSTAAGPAFEGAGLSRGMSAGTGAICAVAEESGQVRYETVGNAPAIGVCGSGILDALAVMLATEAMDDSGYIEEDEAWPIGESGVSVTQRDVRQIQLAKSAICGGILTLLEDQALDAAAIDRFIIAGGFGSSMDLDSAAAIGLFPAALRQKADFIGNGALGGAVMLLRSSALREKSARMAAEATELSLSASPAFMDHYIDCMTFDRF
ncbi:MAG: DUF4445 domain-containing protein [Oscillibacter sp.]|nr:DUF4445 domain-containing protein [Oscillibacter sp.]